MTTRRLTSGLLVFTALSFLNCKDTSEKGLQVCPDEKIVNKMPGPSDSTTPNAYYIYKGERKELTDFDQDWVAKNCDVKETEVH